MTGSLGAAGAAPAPEPTHACVRCGRTIPIDVALCEECNPLGLKQPAATQVHALAAGGILFFVVILAVLGRVGLSGVGPFNGTVGNVTAAAGGGLSVTISVENKGSKSAATTCRVEGSGHPVGGRTQVVQTPIVPAGQSITFTAAVTALGDEVIPLETECQSP